MAGSVIRFSVEEGRKVIIGGRLKGQLSQITHKHTQQQKKTFFSFLSQVVSGYADRNEVSITRQVYWKYFLCPMKTVGRVKPEYISDTNRNVSAVQSTVDHLWLCKVALNRRKFVV